MLGWALLASGTAFADARIEARRHFRNGMSLIGSGQYDDGIGELKRAYAIKPHANVLFNIARAYLDAGRTQDAVDFYRRYLATNPPDSDQIEPIVERLAASLPRPEEKKPPPEEKKPPPEEKIVHAPSVDAETVKRMNALLERLEAAVTKAEAAAKPPAEAGAHPPEAPTPEGLEEGGETAVPYEEVVVTASRRAQSTLEAPNSTTVINADEIRASGAHSIVELLRRVPGAEVMEMGVSSDNVSFRGFNQRIANKVLVLVDGRTEYQDFVGLTIWPEIPIELEEIERI
ncbi:MAG TPA: TonB-dependent receptor plug domain-containing protein [Myxococcaceae bacterium]|nr:TonB-dependent receptor plug domain-containing protein [Myxococcaceae bacterium]